MIVGGADLDPGPEPNTFMASVKCNKEIKGKLTTKQEANFSAWFHFPRNEI